MSRDEHAAIAARGRKRIILIASLIVAVILCGLAAAFLLIPDLVEHPPAEPVVDVKPAAPAPSTAPGELEEASAAEVIAHILAVPIEPVETVDDFDTVMGPVAADGYLRELENLWQELVANGWTLEGAPTVVSAEITDASDTHATVVACIDSSSVRMLDAEGDAIGADAIGPEANTRVRNLFTLEQSSDGVWRITSHSFPNDPAC